LRFDIGGSSFSADVKERLGYSLEEPSPIDGVLVIVSRVHRSQIKNREAARARLLALLQRALKPPKTRRLTKSRRPVREERLASKKQRGIVGRPGTGDGKSRTVSARRVEPERGLGRVFPS
jgi:ribosome-associated protein